MLPQRWGKRLKIHESVQRLMCRFVFLCFGFLPPLLLVVGWGWSTTPWADWLERDRWRDRLSLQLGLPTEVAAVDYLAPKLVRLTGVNLEHPETGAQVAHAETLELRQERGLWKLHIPAAKIELKQLAFAAEAVHERCLCRPQLALPIVDASIGRLDIEDDGLLIESMSLRSEWICRSQQSRCRVEYRPLKDENQLGKLEIDRWHTTERPLSRIVLQTGNGAVAYSLLNAFFPTADRLGPNVAFRGDFEWRQDSQAWNAIIHQGRFEDVSWGQLTSSLPYELTGRGHIELQNVLIADGRISQMQGTVTAQAGRIRRDWLQLSQNYLGLGVDPDVLRQSIDTVPFEAMRIGFQLDAGGLFLQGGIPSSRSDYESSLLADSRDGFVYVRSPAEPIAIDNLMNWIDAVPPLSSIQPAHHQQPSPTIRRADRLRDFLPLR